MYKLDNCIRPRKFSLHVEDAQKAYKARPPSSFFFFSLGTKARAKQTISKMHLHGTCLALAGVLVQTVTANNSPEWQKTRNFI